MVNFEFIPLVGTVAALAVYKNGVVADRKEESAHFAIFPQLAI